MSHQVVRSSIGLLKKVDGFYTTNAKKSIQLLADTPFPGCSNEEPHRRYYREDQIQKTGILQQKH